MHANATQQAPGKIEPNSHNFAHIYVHTMAMTDLPPIAGLGQQELLRSLNTPHGQFVQRQPHPQ
jgi:hypothetical protein